MTAGFPTDDPWGDRQQGLPITGVRPRCWRRGLVQLGAGDPVRVLQPRLRDPRPGRRRRRPGVPYDEFVRTAAAGAARPDRTGFDADEFDQAEPGRRLPARARRLGRGCRSTPTARSRRWAACSRTVADLARWVGRVRGRVPARRRRADGDRPDGVVAAEPAAAPAPSGVAAADAAAAGGDRLAGGRAAAGRPARRRPSTTGSACSSTRTRRSAGWCSHSGGYPGFGIQHALAPGHRHRRDRARQRHLRPHVRRSPASSLRRPGAQLDAPTRWRLAPGTGPTARPWPQTLAAQEKVNRLLADWDDAAADALFTDERRPRRPLPRAPRTPSRLIRERIGDVHRRPRPRGRVRHPGAPPLVADRRERHRRRSQIQLSPERAPRVHVAHPRRPARPRTRSSPGPSTRWSSG